MGKIDRIEINHALDNFFALADKITDRINAKAKEEEDKLIEFIREDTARMKDPESKSDLLKG